MAKHSGMYSSTKRKKELQRQKKKEEKRLRRRKNMKNPSQGSDETKSMNSETEPSVSTTRETD
jgi:hypothetical protein